MLKLRNCQWRTTWKIYFFVPLDMQYKLSLKTNQKITEDVSKFVHKNKSNKVNLRLNNRMVVLTMNSQRYMYRPL